MKKTILLALALLIGVTTVEAKKAKGPVGDCIVRIGTANVVCEKSRKWNVDNGKTSALMAWKKSREAVAKMLSECDCDIYAIQEADQPIREDLPRLLKKLGHKFGYFWAIPDPESSNQDHQLANGFIYRKDRFKLGKKRTFFLSETPEEFSRGWGEKRWVRIAASTEVTDKKSGHKFYIMTTMLSNRAINNEKSGNLLIEREKQYNNGKNASILLGYFASRPNAPLATLLKSHYNDAFYKYTGKKLRGNVINWAGESKGLRSTNNRRSYIYYKDGEQSQCELLKYEVHNKKYSVDGYDIYPSIYLPTIVELKIK